MVLFVFGRLDIDFGEVNLMFNGYCEFLVKIKDWEGDFKNCFGNWVNIFVVDIFSGYVFFIDLFIVMYDGYVDENIVIEEWFVFRIWKMEYRVFLGFEKVWFIGMGEIDSDGDSG